MYQPRFEISSDLLKWIAQATETRVWIAQAIVDVPWLPMLQRETAARLSHSSTSIEGNPLTLPEVEALARGEEVLAETRAKQEVLNSLAAMRWIWKQKTADKITEKNLLYLHRMFTQKLLSEDTAGKYKTRPNRVVDGQGRTIFTPPPPEAAKALTCELLEWMNSKASMNLHPVIISSIAHHRLVSIHPFADGNGRISRALGVWLLYSRGFDTHHLFALDEYFEQDRQKYYSKIQQARDLDDNLSYWLEYVAEGIFVTLKRTKERILSLQVSTNTAHLVLTQRQEEVLRWIRDRGRVRSPELEKAFKFSRSRANQILLPLVKAGLIVREGQTRNTTYKLAGK